MPETKKKTAEKPARIPVCGIGASAGGVEALQQFFTALPDDLGLAYVVVVHLAPDHKSELPGIIGRCTKMPVIQVVDHDKAKLEANQVYVIAPDRKLEISDSSVSASPFDEPRGHRAAIDLFFRSLAANHRDSFAVVLSGTGADGALGARAVKESGGLVLVQDPAEAAHDSMPRAVLATGVADLVLPVRELVERLIDLARNRKRLTPVVRAGEERARIPEDEEQALKGVLELLRKRTSHDFSRYKRSTILRRLSRRMQLSRQMTIADYLRHLQLQATEVQALFDDLLISVTSFFRDPETWTALQEVVIGPLVEHTDPDQQIRVWVPACATGEEAYTLAILFHEEFERRKIRRNLLIFASDVDEGALAIARAGAYPLTVSADISEARFKRYFRRENDHCIIDGELRESIVFTAHSLLRDPPFSRLHLITCRNLLIYLNPELQEQVMRIFRYACRDEGYLLLGASEVADEELFHVLDKKHRIFTLLAKGESARVLPPELLARPAGFSFKLEREARPVKQSMAAEVHLATLEEVSPPSVVVDERGNVLNLSKSASRFFQQGAGPPARRVTELVRPELRDELHALLRRATELPGPQLSLFVPVAFNGSHREVALLAEQRPGQKRGAAQVLVTFLDGGEVKRSPPAAGPERNEDVVRELRDKLRQADQRLETMRDEHYLTNEDLRAANEELQSLNEEYRSTTEELETSKEELQSINEELQTVNNELKIKLEEISDAHSDLENLITATNVATLFLGKDLRIKRFTSELARIFNVKKRDYDRPIGDLTHVLAYDELEDDARRVLADFESVEREVASRDGRTYIARLSPYRRADRSDDGLPEWQTSRPVRPGEEVEGVVITFVDVTAVKAAATALQESERKLDAELKIMHRLHRMTMAVATASDMSAALYEIVDAAVDIHAADFGSVQLLDRESRQLGMAAQRGFELPFIKAFESLDSVYESAGGRVLRTGAPCQIGDVTTDAAYEPYRQIAAEAGYRAVLAVPLIGRNREIVGVLSVYFREPRIFSARDRQLGDLLSQQAADLIQSQAQHQSLARANQLLLKRSSDLEVSRTQLSEQAHELEQQDHNRQEFIAALGHELRNPMAALQAGLALLPTGNERSKTVVPIMRRQLTHMTRLVNDLLDITRISHGRLRLERGEVDLNQAVVTAVESMRPQADAKALKLEQELPAQPLTVYADPERLAQILDNLLRNSLTYTDTGVVTVTVRQEEGHARISVRDTGIGIDPEEAPGLFKPYQQRDEGRRGGGLGLGLTVVKGLVEAHGGTVGFRSDGRGAGAEFSFTLPLAEKKTMGATRQPAVVAPTKAHRILVVDDQHDVADMFAAQLEKMGQQVKIAYGGAAAIEIARRERPRVAFVDLSMPDMDGSEVARRLRREFPANELTLVALTGLGNPAGAAREFDYYLLKPLSAESAVTLLNSLPAGSGAG